MNDNERNQQDHDLARQLQNQERENANVLGAPIVFRFNLPNTDVIPLPSNERVSVFHRYFVISAKDWSDRLAPMPIPPGMQVTTTDLWPIRSFAIYPPRSLHFPIDPSKPVNEVLADTLRVPFGVQVQIRRSNISSLINF
jgi:hypothetical protein